MSFVIPHSLNDAQIGGFGVMAAAYGAHGLEKRVNGDAGKLKVEPPSLLSI